MTRFALLALFLSLAAPVLADDARDRGCAATTAIVAEAVATRAKGTTQAQALKALLAGDVDAKYIAAVGPLVDWVYTLPQDQLTNEAVAAYNDACLAQIR
ncbi:DNA primase [Roseovarius sp. Pro17]|uniref:DNA primase n=1 Tax=Roseovarius sp. Pro17 TaxID=3108175 RepID=UPI002D79C6E4|nr:DNA primase [Roseovarius sp. Pro17]